MSEVLSNKELIEKITTGDLASGGLLKPEQADKFIDYTIDESTLLKLVDVRKVDNPTGEIDMVVIGEPVTESAEENADTGNIYEPTFFKVEYSCKKLRSAWNLTKEALKQNIEKEALRDTLMKAFAKRISTDLELVAIQGDTSLTGSDRLSRLLKRLDGIDKQTQTGVHIIDWNKQPISRQLFSKMLRAMPAKYLQFKQDFRFLMSPSLYQDYADSLTERATNLGDLVLTTKTELLAFGVPCVNVPLMPERRVGDDVLGTVILTIPKNIVVVISREIETYWEFVPRHDRWENTTYTEIDVRILNKDLVVKAINVKIS